MTKARLVIAAVVVEGRTHAQAATDFGCRGRLPALRHAQPAPTAHGGLDTARATAIGLYHRSGKAIPLSLP